MIAFKSLRITTVTFMAWTGSALIAMAVVGAPIGGDASTSALSETPGEQPGSTGAAASFGQRFPTLEVGKPGMSGGVGPSVEPPASRPGEPVEPLNLGFIQPVDSRDVDTPSGAARPPAVKHLIPAGETDDSRRDDGGSASAVRPASLSNGSSDSDPPAAFGVPVPTGGSPDRGRLRISDDPGLAVVFALFFAAGLAAVLAWTRPRKA